MNSGYSTAAAVAEAKRPHRCADFAFRPRKCGKGTKPPRTPPSSPRRRGPIRRVADVLDEVSDLVEPRHCNHTRQGLWVPACAGTTWVKSHAKVRKCQAPTKPNLTSILPAPS